VALAVIAITAGALPMPSAAAQAQPVSPAGRMAAAAGAYQQAQRDLRTVQATLAQLDQQVHDADGQVSAAEARTAADRQREDALRQQVGEYARSAYQTQGSQLTRVLEARSMAEVWDLLAEARVVAERQRSLVAQLDQLRQADEGVRDQARAARQDLARQRDQAGAHLRDLESRLGGLAQLVAAAGQVLAGSAGRVPAGRLPQTTGAAGQCTWYAEQAWVTYSEPGAPALTGNGGEVVSNLARAEGRPVEATPQPGSLVSWMAPLMSGFGHVGYVAAVDHDPGGNLTGYTVWEMNYVGPFQTDARHVAWTGPDARIVFLSSPRPVDPVLAEVTMFGTA